MNRAERRFLKKHVVSVCNGCGCALSGSCHHFVDDHCKDFYLCDSCSLDMVATSCDSDFCSGCSSTDIFKRVCFPDGDSYFFCKDCFASLLASNPNLSSISEDVPPPF